MKVNSNN